MKTSRLTLLIAALFVGAFALADPAGTPRSRSAVTNVDGQNIAPASVNTGPIQATTITANQITGNPTIASGTINMGTNTSVNGGANSRLAAIGMALGGAAGLTQGTISATAFESSPVSPAGTGADTTEDTLMTYSLPASSLSVNSQGFRVTAWGDNNSISTTDVMTVRCYFGATVVLSRVLTASQANTWYANYTVMRTGASAQVATGFLLQNGTAQAWVQSNSSPAETLSGAVTIKCTGQRATSSVANSIRQFGMQVEFFN